MAKQITSTDWHLEGVSVEVRRLVATLAGMRSTKQGELVDELLRQSPELKALAGVVKPLKTTK
jgi:hypothetical protein